MKEKEIIYDLYKESISELKYYIEKYHNEIKFLNIFSSGIFSTLIFDNGGISLDNIDFFIIKKSFSLNCFLIFFIYLILTYLFLLILNSSNEIIISGAKMVYYEKRINSLYNKELIIWESRISSCIRYDNKVFNSEVIKQANRNVNFKKLDKINIFSKKIERDNIILGLNVFFVFFLVQLFIIKWSIKVINFFKPKFSINYLDTSVVLNHNIFTYFITITIIVIFTYNLYNYFKTWTYYNIIIRESLEEISVKLYGKIVD